MKSDIMAVVGLDVEGVDEAGFSAREWSGLVGRRGDDIPRKALRWQQRARG